MGVQVNVPIAGLKDLPPVERVDVRVALGPLPEDLDRLSAAPSRPFYVGEEIDDNGTPAIRVSRLDDGAYYGIAYADGTRIVIDARGAAIWASAPASASIEDTATYVLGPALGFTLRLRGVTCLHASAVAIGGGAVAFVGASGAGKSSVAAAFARAGYPILTDDVLALADRGERFEAQPAYPRVRLWPEAAAALFGSADALPRITSGWDKRYLALGSSRHRFQSDPLPIVAIYLLAPRGAGPTRVREISNRKSALMALVPETYSARLLDRDSRATEFELLGRLVRHVPVRRLAVCDDLDRIGEICDIVSREVECTA